MSPSIQEGLEGPDIPPTAPSAETVEAVQVARTAPPEAVSPSEDSAEAIHAALRDGSLTAGLSVADGLTFSDAMPETTPSRQEILSAAQQRQAALDATPEHQAFKAREAMQDEFTREARVQSLLCEALEARDHDSLVRSVAKAKQLLGEHEWELYQDQLDPYVGASWGDPDDPTDIQQILANSGMRSSELEELVAQADNLNEVAKQQAAYLDAFRAEMGNIEANQAAMKEAVNGHLRTLGLSGDRGRDYVAQAEALAAGEAVDLSAIFLIEGPEAGLEALRRFGGTAAGLQKEAKHDAIRASIREAVAPGEIIGRGLVVNGVPALNPHEQGVFAPDVLNQMQIDRANRVVARVERMSPRAETAAEIRQGIREAVASERSIQAEIARAYEADPNVQERRRQEKLAATNGIFR